MYRPRRTRTMPRKGKRKRSSGTLTHKSKRGRKQKTVPVNEPEVWSSIDPVSGDPIYEVENIVDVRVRQPDNKIQYRLRWKGFNESDDTWENASAVHCGDLIREFEMRATATNRADNGTDGDSSTSTDTDAKSVHIIGQDVPPASMQQNVSHTCTAHSKVTYNPLHSLMII